MEAQLVLDAQAQLGEGALWHPHTQQLYWVDIEGRQLHLYSPVSEALRSIDVRERIGTVVPYADDKVLVALQNGIHELDLASETLTLIANPLEGQDDMRFNDGKCDPAGRLWVGSMHLSVHPEVAALYCLDTDRTLRRVLDKVSISNGIIWSIDHQTMYYIDTPTGMVRAFDYDVATGNVSNPRPAVTVPEATGHPDGMTIDAEGMLWVAHWGGGSVGRYDPGSGQLLQQVKVPAPFVTSCAFGGEQLDILYITTARKDMNEEQLREFPHGGGVFAARPGVKGVAADVFEG